MPRAVIVESISSPANFSTDLTITVVYFNTGPDSFLSFVVMI